VLEEDIPSENQHQSTTGAVSKPRQIWLLVTCDAGTEPVQDRTDRIEQQPLSLVAKHAYVIKDRGEEDPEREEGLDDELNIPKKETRSRHYNANSGSQHDHRKQQQRYPCLLYTSRCV